MTNVIAETIIESARKVGITVALVDGKWNLRYTAKPEMNPLRLTHLSDVRLIVLAEITAQLQGV